jgi:hypothetical protein
MCRAGRLLECRRPWLRRLAAWTADGSSGGGESSTQWTALGALWPAAAATALEIAQETGAQGGAVQLAYAALDSAVLPAVAAKHGAGAARAALGSGGELPLELLPRLVLLPATVPGDTARAHAAALQRCVGPLSSVMCAPTGPVRKYTGAIKHVSLACNGPCHYTFDAGHGTLMGDFLT